jgi:acetyltransferase
MLSPMTADDSLPDGATPAMLRDGSVVVLRPIRPSDEPLLVVFHAGLSPRTVYQRYFHVTSLEQRTGQQRLELACQADPTIGAALVAEQRTDEGTLTILAIGRMRHTEPAGTAELAIMVADRVQGQGLGTAMLRSLVQLARRLGVRRIYGDMFADNEPMRALLRRGGFTIASLPGDARLLRAELGLA